MMTSSSTVSVEPCSRAETTSLSLKGSLARMARVQTRQTSTVERLIVEFM